MQKNVAGQKWIVFAFNRLNGSPKTGDAAQITCKVSADHGAAGALTDTNPTEIEDGFYMFDYTSSQPIGKDKVNQRLAKIGRMYKGTSKVRHIATVVRDEVGYETIRNSVTVPLVGLKVAIHYGCHLLKPSRIMNVDNPDDPQVLENLIRALGADPVRHRNWYLCCGKACQNEDIPNNMMHDLLSSVHDEKADILGMICPTCFGQFDHGQKKIAKLFEEDFHTPAVYYFQLLALAQGIPYDDLGFQKQRFKPTVLQQFDEAAASAPPA